MSSSDPHIFLELGCGAPGTSQLPAMFSDWRRVRVDIDPGVQPDVLADLIDLAPIEAGFADAVWAAHCIEHLYEHDVATALTEIKRVLKDDGFACIIVPDLQTIAERVADDRMDEPIYESPAGPVTPHDVLYGYGPAISSGRLTMAHHSGFTPASLTRHVAQAGFGGFALLRRASFELAAVIRKSDWRHADDCESLLARLAL